MLQVRLDWLVYDSNFFDERILTCELAFYYH